MNQPWREQAGPPAGIPIADKTVASVFQGLGELTEEGWPAWAAQRLMEDYPVFDQPEEYTYENLIHYVVVRVSGEKNQTQIGKDLDQTEKWKYAGSEERNEALYDILYRLLVEPYLFLSVHRKGENGYA